MIDVEYTIANYSTTSNWQLIIESIRLGRNRYLLA